MKAVFFDVDGTLIEGTNPDFRYMREPVKQAIRKLQAAGNYVFIASGRSYAFLDEKIRDFGFDGFVLLNGAVIYFHDKIIYRDPLAKDLVVKITSTCKAHNMEYTLQSDKEAYVHRDFKYILDRLAEYGIFAEQLCLDFDEKNIDVYKMEIDSPTNADKNYIIDILPESMTYVEELNSKHCHIEVYAKRNSKATGILHVLDILNIDVKDSYAFGDGDNDIEMLSTVGFSMAMGNATPKALEAAKVVVPSILEDGVAYGIEKYIL